MKNATKLYGNWICTIEDKIAKDIFGEEGPVPKWSLSKFMNWMEAT